MNFDYTPTPKSRGTYKDRTPGKKAMMVRRGLLPSAPPSVSLDKRGHRQSARHSSKAARPIYDPIGAMQSRQQVTERWSKLCLEYEKHRLTSQGIQSFGALEDTPSGPGDM